MSALSIGYARVSTEGQDLSAQRDALAGLGVAPQRVYLDYGLTGINRDRPGLREALAACRDGDTLVVTKLLRETADLMSELLEQAADSGDLDRQDEHVPDEAFIRLMDSFADASHPAVARLRELIAERGWTGWTRIEKREP